MDVFDCEFSYNVGACHGLDHLSAKWRVYYGNNLVFTFSFVSCSSLVLPLQNIQGLYVRNLALPEEKQEEGTINQFEAKYTIITKREASKVYTKQ